MVETKIQSPRFDEISGNWLCLDFTHTLDGRYSDQPQELLTSFHDLVAWGLYMHIVTDGEVQRLLEEAARRPAEAPAALQRAIMLREAIYRIFLAIADGTSPEEDDLILLNTMLSDAMSHARIVPKAGGFIWDWTGKEAPLDAILWQVARSAADLLTAQELDAVRACSAEDCRWLFLDTSKNKSRRWCDMKSCGNRAKARRHYERKRPA